MTAPAFRPELLPEDALLSFITRQQIGRAHV